MKYKVGDRVRIVSEEICWVSSEMDAYLGKVMTIKNICHDKFYLMIEDDSEWVWFDSMIAGLASETPFDFGAWKDRKVCMLCRTKEEAEDFCREIDKAGLRWIDGSSYLKYDSFKYYGENTVYYFSEGFFGDVESAEDRGNRILEWSDYRSTEPPKEKEQEKTMETKIDDKPLSYCRAIEIWNKLCNSYNEKECIEKCPLHFNQNKYGVRCEVILKKHPSEAETILKKWAAEHPVKTNRDKFVKFFGEIQKYDDECEHYCVTVPCQSCDWWHQEYVEPEK